MNVHGVAVSEEHRFEIFCWDIRIYKNIMILWVNIFMCDEKSGQIKIKTITQTFLSKI